jgi:superfamily II DNA helicase RecQ
MCRDQCEGVAKAINSCFCDSDTDVEVAHYHAGLGQSDRDRIQQQWSDGGIVVCTAHSYMHACW